MKSITLLTLISLFYFTANTQNKTSVARKPVAKSVLNTPTIALKTAKDSASYALGVNIARNMQSQNISSLNMQLFEKGLNDVLQKKKLGLSEEDCNASISSYLQKAKAEKINANKETGKKFLEANGERKGVITLADGLQYEILKAGTDTIKPKLTDKVRCHYHGTLIDGTVFDSSVERGEPITISLTGVIIGWQEALQLMTVGSKWRLFLPSSLAYGDNAAGPKIEPGSTLIFDVELLGIEK